MAAQATELEAELAHVREWVAASQVRQPLQPRGPREPFTALRQGEAHHAVVTKVQRRDGLLCDACYVDFGFECLGFLNKIVFDKAGRRIRVGDRMVVYVHSMSEAF